jgi:hypothetical protein
VKQISVFLALSSFPPKGVTFLPSPPSDSAACPIHKTYAGTWTLMNVNELTIIQTIWQHTGLTSTARRCTKTSLRGSALGGRGSTVILSQKEVSLVGRGMGVDNAGAREELGYSYNLSWYWGLVH